LPRVAAYVAARKPYGWYRHSWVALAIVITIAFGVIALLITLMHMADAQAMRAAIGSGALLYDAHFLVGFCISALAAIFVAAAAANALPLLSSRLLASAYADAMLHPPKTAHAQATRKYLASLYDAHANEPDPQTFLRAVATDVVKPFALAGALLSTLALSVSAREIDSYALYYQTAYVQRHFLPTPPTTHAWCR